jgi:hypothetical protein
VAQEVKALFAVGGKLVADWWPVSTMRTIAAHAEHGMIGNSASSCQIAILVMSNGDNFRLPRNSLGIRRMGRRDHIPVAPSCSRSRCYANCQQPGISPGAAEFEGAWFRCSLEEGEKIGVVRVYQMMNGFVAESQNNWP